MTSFRICSPRGDSRGTSSRCRLGCELSGLPALRSLCAGSAASIAAAMTRRQVDFGCAQPRSTHSQSPLIVKQMMSVQVQTAGVVTLSA